MISISAYRFEALGISLRQTPQERQIGGTGRR
jgi:hypothetical protein